MLSLNSFHHNEAPNPTHDDKYAFYSQSRYAFDELRYRRLEWKCDALNQKSASAARRLGFTFEGVLPSQSCLQNCIRITVCRSCGSGLAAQTRNLETLCLYITGLFRQDMIVKGRNRDTAWFSIIDKEWSDYLRDSYQKWFAPNNFTSDGRQVTRLQEI
jgi:hypothetical protein